MYVRSKSKSSITIVIGSLRGLRVNYTHQKLERKTRSLTNAPNYLTLVIAQSLARRAFSLPVNDSRDESIYQQVCREATRHRVCLTMHWGTLDVLRSSSLTMVFLSNLTTACRR